MSQVDKFYLLLLSEEMTANTSRGEQYVIDVICSSKTKSLWESVGYIHHLKFVLQFILCQEH